MFKVKKYALAAMLAAVCAGGTAVSASAEVTGDVNSDGRVDVFDLVLCRRGVINMFSGGQVDPHTDIDGDGQTQINDLVLLSQFLLGEKTKLPQVTTETTTAASSEKTTASTTTEAAVTTTTAANGDTYMQKMAADIHIHEEPSSTEMRSGVDYGTIEKKTYFSNDAQRDKNLNILLPPGYDPNEKYPVLYVFHGIFGNEDSMLGDDMKIQTMLGNLIASGEAEKMIVVFPQMFTTSEDIFPSFTNESSRAYDAIREDLENSIMPFMELLRDFQWAAERLSMLG